MSLEEILSAFILQQFTCFYQYLLKSLAIPRIFRIFASPNEISDCSNRTFRGCRTLVFTNWVQKYSIKSEYQNKIKDIFWKSLIFNYCLHFAKNCKKTTFYYTHLNIIKLWKKKHQTQKKDYSY